MIDDQLCLLGSNALDQTGTEITDDAFSRRRKTRRKAGHMKLAAIARIILPLSLNCQQFTYMDAGQHTNNCREFVTEEPPTIIRAKTRHNIMIVFIAKDNAFNRTIEPQHTHLFPQEHPFVGNDPPYLSTKDYPWTAQYATIGRVKNTFSKEDEVQCQEPDPLLGMGL